MSKKINAERLPFIKLGGRTFTILFPDLLRPLSCAERQRLKESIERRGVRVGVLIDENLGVIDGGHRLALASELGLTEVPMEIQAGLSLDEKRALAVEVNEARRQLSEADRKEVHAKLRAEGLTLEKIAEKTGSSKDTVRRDLKNGTFSNEKVEPIVGKDGKARPATYKSRLVKVETAQEAGQVKDIFEAAGEDPVHFQSLLDEVEGDVEETAEKRRKIQEIVAAARDNPADFADLLDEYENGRIGLDRAYKVLKRCLDEDQASKTLMPRRNPMLEWHDLREYFDKKIIMIEQLWGEDIARCLKRTSADERRSFLRYIGPIIATCQEWQREVQNYECKKSKTAGGSS